MESFPRAVWIDFGILSSIGSGKGIEPPIELGLVSSQSRSKLNCPSNPQEPHLGQREQLFMGGNTLKIMRAHGVLIKGAGAYLA